MPPFSLATTSPNRKKPRPLVGAFSFLTWAAGSFPGTAEAVSLKHYRARGGVRVSRSVPAARRLQSPAPPPVHRIPLERAGVQLCEIYSAGSSLGLPCARIRDLVTQTAA